MGEEGDELRYLHDTTVSAEQGRDTARDALTARTDQNAWRGMMIERFDELLDLQVKMIRVTAHLVKQLQNNTPESRPAPGADTPPPVSTETGPRVPEIINS